jgi:hypothetical protein
MALIATLAACSKPPSSSPNPVFVDWVENHTAATTICLFTNEISREMHGLGPTGTDPDTGVPESWARHWNDRVVYLVDQRAGIPPEGVSAYRGPSGRAIMQWVLWQRELAGLPRLAPDARTEQLVATLYADVSVGSAETDAYLETTELMCPVDSPT